MNSNFLVQGIFKPFFFPPLLFYNGYFWSKWIAYFDRKWNHYPASLQQCSRSASFWVKSSCPVQTSMCCFRELTSYGVMKAMPSRHANCGNVQLYHSGGKMRVYFTVINFILPITGSNKIFPILTVTDRALFICLGACAVTVVLVKSAFPRGNFLYLHHETIHLSSHRLITSIIPLLADGWETTFWNIVFYGTYFMSAVETQLEAEHLCAPPPNLVAEYIIN